MTQLNYPSGYAALESCLQRFGAFRKRWAWIDAMAWFTIIGPGTLLLVMVADYFLLLPWFVLLPLFATTVGLTLYATVRFAIVPLMNRIEIEREAMAIEALHGKLDNQIIGSLQLGREVAQAQAAGTNVGYSPNLVAALIARTVENVGKINLPALVDRRKAIRDLRIAAGVIVCFIMFAGLAPGFVVGRINDLRDAYATFMDMLFPVDMQVAPGDVTLVRGRPVSLAVKMAGARRPRVKLRRVDLKSKAASVDELTLARGQAGLDIASAQESFTYEFDYGGRRSAEHRVLVGDLPAVAAMNTEIAFPAYTGMPPRTLVGRLPKLGALSGSGVLVSLASTVDLHPELSYVTWQDGSRQPLSVSGRFAHFSFNVDRPERATIHLTGSLGKGFEMPDPIGLEVVVQRDAPPTVDVLLRNRKFTMLSEEATHFGVTAIAEDDFGVAEVLLDYRIDTIDPLLNRPTRQGTISRMIDPPKDRVKISFLDIFKGLAPPLEPGDRITITVSAKDNNTETGPGVGRAAPIEIIVVRPDLGAYVEQQFAFGGDPLLGNLRKVQRTTNLLIEAEKTTLTEPKAAVDKQDVKSRAGSEGWPGGSEDSVGDYFRLLSGEK